MGRIHVLSLLATVLLSLVSASVYSISVNVMPQLAIMEWLIEIEGANGRAMLKAIPLDDNSNLTSDYKLLGFKLKTTVKYYINPSNNYNLPEDYVVANIIAAAETWDSMTSVELFDYSGKSDASASVLDGMNVVSWGAYSKVNVIAVTFIWYNRATKSIIEVDTLLNTYYMWGLLGEWNRMDVQNIMTHEFGHWCGLGDLYNNRDYWLTMYGYASYGETYKRTLGLGDTIGLQKLYGG